MPSTIKLSPENLRWKVQKEKSEYRTNNTEVIFNLFIFKSNEKIRSIEPNFSCHFNWRLTNCFCKWKNPFSNLSACLINVQHGENRLSPFNLKLSATAQTGSILSRSFCNSRLPSRGYFPSCPLLTFSRGHSLLHFKKIKDNGEEDFLVENLTIETK